MVIGFIFFFSFTLLQLQNQSDHCRMVSVMAAQETPAAEPVPSTGDYDTGETPDVSVLFSGDPGFLLKLFVPFLEANLS
ncbi:hypothetical protein L1987_09690 [Smallanthus sonchifolius]|uniref:Uncharacterized protein n=1 Tax=Smallanthus sonchifolius TaxID=185202 RepID=A0ACB9JQC3_9ASTR|nr:hypothetical protein L1987_09690 [Smallanthus sonchifolius]